MTRDAASPKAQSLAQSGAEAVEATLTDEGSLRRAFDPEPVSLTDFLAAHRAELGT